MKIRITTLPGDGIGPEVTAQAVRVLTEVADGFGHDLKLEQKEIGGEALTKFGNPLPEATIQSCLASQAVLLGAVGTPAFDHNPRELRPEAGLLRIRKELGAFANLRPAVFYPALAACSPLREELVRGTDILIVRELLGGLYFGEPRAIENATDSDHASCRRETRQAVNTMRYSEPEVERVARVAFALARTRRRRVLSVDKANVLECSRLWREVVTRIGTEYPDVHLSHMYVDAAATVAGAQAHAFRRYSHREHVWRHSLRPGGWHRGRAWTCLPPPALEAQSACMSRCTAPRPTLRAKASLIRWAQFFPWP